MAVKSRLKLILRAVGGCDQKGWNAGAVEVLAVFKKVRDMDCSYMIVHFIIIPEAV